MRETSDMEFDLVRRRADAVNCYVNRHKNFDPARGGGDLSLQPRRKFRREHVDTILGYATADEIHAELAKIENSNYANGDSHVG